MKQIRRPVQSLVLFSLILILTIGTGCTETSSSQVLDNYLERLARTLHQKLPNLTDSGPPAIKTEKLSYQWGYAGTFKPLTTSSQSTISILDFLSLYGCDIQLVIAERNSSLGKFAPASQNLIRHLRFLHYAPACIQQLEGEQNSELAEQLKAEQRRKQQQLPFLIWQALLNEQEAKSFWKQPHTLDNYPNYVSIAPELAIKRLSYLSQQWLNSQYDEGLNELETLLADLRTGDGGSLLMSFNLLSDKLQQGNQMIERYVETETCFNGRPSINSKVLNNVIEKFFVGEVQQWSAQLSQRYYSLIEAYLALEAQFEDMEPAHYSHWRQKRHQQLETGLTSSVHHVQQLKKALQACTQLEGSSP